MDVKRIDERTVELQGTAEEFGFVVDSVTAAAEADEHDAAMIHDPIGDHEDGDNVQAQLNVMPDADGLLTARITSEMAVTAFRGARLAAADCGKLIAVMGGNARVVTDPLHIRKLGFAAVTRDLTDVVEEIVGEE